MKNRRIFRIKRAIEKLVMDEHMKKLFYSISIKGRGPGAETN